MVKIGIPMRYYHLSDGRCILYLGEKTRQTIQKAGGFIIPIIPVQDVDYYDTRWNEFELLTEDEKEIIQKYLDMVDGVLFPGGYKLTPFDQYLLEQCIERKIPTLGICLGMQLMSSYKRNFQVVENNSFVEHFQEDDNLLSHKVTVKKDTALYKILEKDEIMVNSFHHFHVVENEHFVSSAISEDGYIEGIEFGDDVFHVGVQWHPEVSYDFDDNSRKIIDAFIDSCK